MCRFIRPARRERVATADAQPTASAEGLCCTDEVAAAEFNRAFVAMQYYGYLRRTPEDEDCQAWPRVINQDPNNVHRMVNGFMNSGEYRLRFGQP